MCVTDFAKVWNAELRLYSFHMYTTFCQIAFDVLLQQIMQLYIQMPAVN